MSRDDTASNDRFQRDNREVLEQLRDGDCDAWNSVELRLGERDRELREQRNEWAKPNLGQLGAALAVSPRPVARASRELHRHRPHKIRQDGEGRTLSLIHI